MQLPEFPTLHTGSQVEPPLFHTTWLSSKVGCKLSQIGHPQPMEKSYGGNHQRKRLPGSSCATHRGSTSMMCSTTLSALPRLDTVLASFRILGFWFCGPTSCTKECAALTTSAAQLFPQAHDESQSFRTWEPLDAGGDIEASLAWAHAALCLKVGMAPQENQMNQKSQNSYTLWHQGPDGWWLGLVGGGWVVGDGWRLVVG